MITRVELGLNPKIWKEYAEAFKHAVPQLEAQSFVSDDPAVANANGSSATLMGLNHGTLMKDLERLNDLVLIARNIVLYKPAQDLAGAYGFDQTILKLIDVCIRVTARGFDGDGGIRNEAQWGLVIQSCKFVLRP